MGAQERVPAGVRKPPLVLIVEDDPETRRLYALALAGSGFDTDEAHNGFQALDKATATSPDLILHAS